MPRPAPRKSSSRKSWRPQIGYSTNVHPGETLDAVRESLREFTAPIRERVYGRGTATSPAPRAGLELRIGIGSATELSTDAAREEFRELLETLGLELFSVNAYPLSDFHAKRVKETVYQPSWAEKDRSRWTSRIGEIAAALVPEGSEVSISTLGGCFRGHGHGPATFRKLAARYLETCGAFLDTSEKTGRTLFLAAEPEPETTFETTADVVEFFESWLLPLALERWKRRGTKARIESLLRNVFTVNVDTCHLSVLFDDPVESLRTLDRGGLRVGKLHVTNAVSLPRPYRSPKAYAQLRAMHEPRYFHQFCAADASGRPVWRGLDLDELPRALDLAAHPDVAEIRSHFHVPLYLERHGLLHTTRRDTERALEEVARTGNVRHLVFETYTWPILNAGSARTRQGARTTGSRKAGTRTATSERDRDAALRRGITREWKWLLETLKGLGARDLDEGFVR